MPTETLTRKKIYTGNGSQKVFPFTFSIHEESDIVVKLRTIATGAVTTLALTTHYTVTKTGANWDNGGNVVTVAAYASTYTITIIRVTQLTQTKDYVEGGNFPAESHEEGLDKLTRIVQELQEEVKRCLKMPDTDDEDLNMEIPNTVARLSKWLGFGPGGEPTCVQTTPPTVGVSPFAETVLDDADAEAVRTTLDVLQDIADVITASLIGDEAISVDHLKGDASYKNAVTRYYAVSLVGYASGAGAKLYGYKIEFTAADNGYLPINLPDGAIVTNLFSSVNQQEGTVSICLQRSTKTGTGEEQLAINTHDGVGTTNLNDDTISDATIDNQDYNYYTKVLRGGHVNTATIFGIVITYTITRPLP